MFKIVQNRLVKAWPATVHVPMDGGKIEAHQIELDFIVLDSDEFSQYSQQGDKALLEKVIKGWNGIGDEQGKPLLFSKKNLAILATNSCFAQGVFMAYLQAQSGKASEKNS